MNSAPVIEIRGVGKRYNITHRKGGYIALRDVIMDSLRSPFRYLKAKIKKAVGKETKEEFWALKDVSFEIKKGEVIGIIGPNGSGKSTLLKILSQITPPTEGEIVLNGKVGSLLEVGTGFHPELTGRENIFLNGAILGMPQKEIAKKFDDIVAFAGIEQFLDTPVKYYSSGMYVRLAFSVAAHMEPDILLVDEVLAVGDAEFQKKCLGKMEEVTKSEGRTILFVSHNMAAIQQLCTKTVLLKKGRVKMFGETNDVIAYYTNSGQNLNSVSSFRHIDKNDACITQISLLGQDGNPSARLPLNEKFFIEVEYEVHKTTNATISFFFSTQGDMFFVSSEADGTRSLREYPPGKYVSLLEIPENFFNTGNYSFEVHLHDPMITGYDSKTNFSFEVLDAQSARTEIFKGNIKGKIASILKIETKKL